MNLAALFKSKTVWGGVIAGGTQIVSTMFPALEAGLFGPKAQGVAIGVGIILGAVGVKSAISKLPNGQPGRL